MNSGGTTLSYSDLLLSIAVAQWDTLDAREEIHSLVDDLNQIGEGFSFTKDLILKAGLMLSDIGNVGFKVENFNKENMDTLESNWRRIRESLMITVQLLASFGLNSKSLRANSSILPIAYYISHHGLKENYLTKNDFAIDRGNIKLWLFKSLLKSSGIWGSGLDSLLTQLRHTISVTDNSTFPIEEIEHVMSSRGKSLKFENEEIEDLCELEYNNPRTLPLLSIIFEGFDFTRQIQIDHIFPKSVFSPKNLTLLGIPVEQQSEFSDKMKRLPNLQLLDGTINNQKKAQMPHLYFQKSYPTASSLQNYLQTQAINKLPESLSEFPTFYAERKELLKARIKNILS